MRKKRRQGQRNSRRMVTETKRKERKMDWRQRHRDGERENEGQRKRVREMELEKERWSHPKKEKDGDRERIVPERSDEREREERGGEPAYASRASRGFERIAGALDRRR